MDAWTTEHYMGRITVALEGIFAELQEMRKDYVEGQSVVCEDGYTLHDFDSIEFNKSYENN